jgi:hypothetical protein
MKAVTLGLGALMIIVVGAVVILARRQPVPSYLAMLHLNDCNLPCWVGIEPGRTTLNQAVSLIKQTYTVNSHYTAFIDTHIAGTVYITLRDSKPPFSVAGISLDTQDTQNNAIVRAITFYFDSPDSYPISLAEVWNTLGAPEKINFIQPLNRNAYFMSLNYGFDRNHGIDMVVEPVQARLDWTQRAEWFRFMDFGGLAKDLQKEVALPWRGFTPLNHYGLP